MSVSRAFVCASVFFECFEFACVVSICMHVRACVCVCLQTLLSQVDESA